MFVVVGSLMFLGCPLRMVLRLAGGDLNALLGLAGFGTGIWVGVQFLHRGGFTLKRTYFLQRGGEGYLFRFCRFACFYFCLLNRHFCSLATKALAHFAHHAPRPGRGPNYWGGCRAKEQAMHGGGGIRDLIMFKDTHLISGFAAVFAVAYWAICSLAV